MVLFKRYAVKLLRMLAGFAVISFSVFVSKQAFCLSPWNVLNDGLSNVSGISIGTASIIVSSVILFIDMVSREKLGFGSLLNVVLLGTLTDMFIALNTRYPFLPRVDSIPAQIALCLLAICLNDLGIFLYISAEMGAGPRDTLNVYLSRRMHAPIGLCKLSLEAMAGLTGWLLGGEIGIGTFISVLLGGPILQLVFRLFAYDPTAVQNESFRDTVLSIAARR